MMRADHGSTSSGLVGQGHSLVARFRRVGPRAWLQRSFWALMVVAHLPAWAATFGVSGAAADGFDLGRATLLTATQLFFLFKLLDVHWLRLPRDRRAWLAAVCMIALLHAGVARRLCTDTGTLDASFLQAVLVGGVATVLRVPLDTLPQETRASRPRATRRQAGELRNRLLARVEQLVPRPRYLLAVCAGHINRAPPR